MEVTHHDPLQERRYRLLSGFTLGYLRSFLSVQEGGRCEDGHTLSSPSNPPPLPPPLGTVIIVDMDSNEEEKLLVTSQGGATGLNLKEDERIYFGGLPTIGNYRYTGSTHRAAVAQGLTQPSHSTLTQGA